MGINVGTAAPYVAAGLEFLGSERANATNAQTAREQMAFQERMSSTSYQRAVADMRAAGLNPALAYQQGGASSPAGASYDAENVGAAASRGFASGTSAKAVAVQTAADVELKRASADKTQAEANQIKLESALRVKGLQSGIELTNASAGAQSTLGSLRAMEYGYLSDTYKARVEAGQLAPAQARMKLAEDKQRIDLMSQAELESRVRTRVGALNIPGAKNRAAAESSWWKRDVAPFLSDAGAVARMMGGFY